MNIIIICSILTLFPSGKHRHRYYICIIQIFEQLRFFDFVMGSRAGAVSHRCGLRFDSELGPYCMWAEFVVGSFSTLRGFTPGTPVFPSPEKPALLNSNSTRNAWTHNTWASGSGDWVATLRIIKLKQLDLFELEMKHDSSSSAWFH